MPPVRSGPASGSREPAPPDGEEERPEPQDVEPKSEIKEQEKVPEKKEPNPVHQPIYHLHFGELMKNSNHQLSYWNITICRQINSNVELPPWNFPRKFMNDMIWSQNNVKRARSRRLQHHELRFQESGVKSLVNSLLLTMVKFHCQLTENFSFFWSLMVQHLWLLHMLFRQLPMLKRSSFL